MGKIVLHFIKCFLYPYSYSVWLSTIDRAIRSRRHVRFFHPLPRYTHKETPQSPYVIFHITFRTRRSRISVMPIPLSLTQLQLCKWKHGSRRTSNRIFRDSSRTKETHTHTQQHSKNEAGLILFALRGRISRRGRNQSVAWYCYVV